MEPNPFDLLPTFPESCSASFSDAATCVGLVGLYGILIFLVAPVTYMLVNDSWFMSQAVYKGKDPTDAAIKESIYISMIIVAIGVAIGIVVVVWKIVEWVMKKILRPFAQRPHHM